MEIEKKYEDMLMQEAERKEKQRQASANWYHRNVETISQKRKDQYKLKPKVKKERTASMKAKQSAYYVANKDQILNQRKATYEVRKKIPLTAEQLAARKRYRETHKEKIKASTIKYYELHRDEIQRKDRERYQKTKLAKLLVKLGTHTKANESP